MSRLKGIINGYFDVVVMQFIKAVIQCSLQWLNNNSCFYLDKMIITSIEDQPVQPDISRSPESIVLEHFSSDGTEAFKLFVS